MYATVILLDQPKVPHCWRKFKREPVWPWPWQQAKWWSILKINCLQGENPLQPRSMTISPSEVIS